MKLTLALSLSAALCASAELPPLYTAQNFKVMRFDVGRDEPEATKKLVREFQNLLEKNQGHRPEFFQYAGELAGDIHVSTQPWDAQGAYRVAFENMVVTIHGSDFAGTEAGLLEVITLYKNAIAEGRKFDWSALSITHGPQEEELRAKTIEEVRKTRKGAKEWENEFVNAVNREPARAYSFPLENEAAALTHDEPHTPYTLSLNGNWKFNWCGSPDLRNKYFYLVDIDDSDWFTIDVPSCVEARGWGSPHYTNINYPHASTPPKIGTEYNPVSSYRTRFTIPDRWFKEKRDIFLRFDGVYSAFYVWVNGKAVGYSEDAALPAEFNISKYITTGENLLAVEVYRWSDGAYIEDQDYFRWSGIYRDVSLFATPKFELRDFFAWSDLSSDFQQATLNLRVKARSEENNSGTFTASLFDADFKKVADFKATQVSGDGTPSQTSLAIDAPHLWSAEDPYLYTLVIRLGDDVRSCKFGFRKCEIVGHRVLFNGKPIKFRGVNRHDASPENGRSVSKNEMLKDILLMKRHNIDTIRTSHYSNHPYFYYLCDRYGIYVQAEANVETHGMGYGVASLANPPSWTQAHVERNVNQVENYKNCPSIWMWSLGNEAGPGHSFKYAREAVEKADPTRPVSYRNDNEKFIMDGTGYPNIAKLIERGQYAKPFFLSEYAHCMGNALGNFKEYWDTFYTYESLCGGAIWDWVDQAIWKETDRIGPDGKRVRYLAYGGDFDDVPNDANFCANGVIDAQRNITPKLLEVKHVQQQIIVKGWSGDFSKPKLSVENRFLFTDLNSFEGRWELTRDGVKVAEGSFNIPSMPPLTVGEIELPQNNQCVNTADNDGEYIYNISFHLKSDTLWAKQGYEIARDQLLRDKAAETAKVVSLASDNVSVTDSNGIIKLSAGKTELSLSRKTGTICKLAINGKQLMADEAGIVHGPRLSCFRALTDNDVWLRNGKGSIYESGLTQLRYHPRTMKVKTNNDKFESVESVIEITGSKSAGFIHKAIFTLNGKGEIAIENEVTPHGKMPIALPRLGVTMLLDTSLEEMRWFGRGPQENYIDRCTGSFIGLYTSTVTDQFVNYIRPQDCGYKTDVRWVEFGNALRFSGSQNLFVQALHYNAEELEFSRHRNHQERYYAPLIPHKEIYLNLDIRQLGLGGASCGPRPEAQYIFPIQKENWTYYITPALLQ